MKKRKKGASHVEFVLSFVIFVVFLIFLYNGLEPIVKSAGSKQFILGHLKLSLVENLTLSDFTIQTFTIELPEGETLKSCVEVKGGDMKQIMTDNCNGLLIKDDKGNILNFTIKGTGVGDKCVNPAHIYIAPLDPSIKFLKIFFATDFEEISPAIDETLYGGSISVSDCTSLTQGEYDVKAIVEKEVISETNVDDIIDGYEDNYDELNYALGVPSGSDWNFEFQTIEFINEEGEVDPIKPTNAMEPPENVNVYVGEFPIQYIDEEATTKIGFIRVTVW